MVNKKIERTRPKKSEKESLEEKEEVDSPQMESLKVLDVQQENQNPDSEEILGKRPFLNPLNALMMQNLNQTHQNQRKRDIKQNYKAKLPLDKLIQEHEKKKLQLTELIDKKQAIQDQLKDLWGKIGHKKTDHELQAEEDKKVQVVLNDQAEIYQKQKSHWDFLLKEMIWMSDDFEKEGKKKQNDAKKCIKNCKKFLHEKQMNKEKKVREQKIELKRKSKYMSNIVQLYWKSCEKIVKHNYNVEYEKKRQQMRTKKLENFVQKHLKLSVKVAETLNTKQFVKQSQYKVTEADEKNKEDNQVLNVDDGQKQIKIYDSQDPIAMNHVDKQSEKSQEDKQGEMTAPEDLNQNIFQPTGHTLDQAQVSTQIPFLLRGSLREYQIIGLDWMVALHNKKLNGILADEMGLGKTIQTISMLASLACDKGIWGPHLIVVPTTIIMNWEMEFKRWCPGFKILTYFGSQKERKIKRHGWSKENSFHICITSYKLVIQDHFAFRRKKWYYMILDEAQNIKNFKSQRWQTLLRFNTKRRLLLTGTPLQNDVMELWSLMHFLMPKIFSNMQDFKDWFQNPFSQSLNQNKSLNLRVVQKLQSILRPFLLRRMKRDVEKQLPEKIEHIVQCNLSRRQRLLYDEYINTDRTMNILGDSDFFSIMSVLMQLRKVCNHPDLFEARSIESPFILSNADRINYHYPTFAFKEVQNQFTENDVNLQNMNLKLINNQNYSNLVCQRQKELLPKVGMQEFMYQNIRNIEPNVSKYLDNSLSVSQMNSRPFADGLASSQKSFVNCNTFLKGNCQKLRQTIPNIMPFDSGTTFKKNYNMHYHEVPRYLNAACIPFSQQYFSQNEYDQIRYSSYVNGPMNAVKQYKSAIQVDEQQQVFLKFSRYLSIVHSLDKQNRLNILYGCPIYGYDLRKAVEVTILCSDIFDQKKFKYTNWKNVDNNPQDILNMPQSVFNPFCKQDKSKDAVIQDWPYQSDIEIENINKTNLFIKEVTNKSREDTRLKKEQKEREEREAKMKQPKKVQRRVQEDIECTETQLLLTIDMKAINEELAAGVKESVPEKKQDEDVKMEVEDNKDDGEQKKEDEEMKEEPKPEGQVAQETEEPALNKNVQFEEKEVKFTKKQTRVYEETITYEEYLKEFKPEQKLEKIEPKVQRVQAQDYKYLQSRDQEQQQGLLSISYKNTDTLKNLIISPMQRAIQMEETIKTFKVIVPKVVAKPVNFVLSKIYTQQQKDTAFERFMHQKLMQHRNVNQSLKYSNFLFFPHKNLIQYDCGKLQKLAQLLKTLYNKGSKVIIFTQMTKMLDIFEQFLNLHGYIYVRLDGSVKTENRQKLVDRFNFNRKIFCFISSTRCGGVGINLTGADCVVFYDTDWNPAMDKQAQDRCHRIGQTKTVHIYRLISINTIEENIFKKSLQKREIGGLIIEGNFDQEFFEKVNVRDILNMDQNNNRSKQDLLSSLIQPKQRNVFQDENIVFDDGNDDIIINQEDESLHNDSGDITDEEEDPDRQQVIDFAPETADQRIDKKIQKLEERELKQIQRQREIEQYRRRFEEALIRIEDQEEVDAMQDANQEIKDTRAEDDNEFDEIIKNDENNQPLTEDQAEKIKELQANQKINDGIPITQGEIKKHQEIEWQTNKNLNDITKSCIRHFKSSFDFNNYQKERSQRDSKFVTLEQEEQNMDKNQSHEGSSVADDNSNKSENNSEFSFSEDENCIQTNQHEEMQWDRSQAQTLYQQTKADLDNLLNQMQEELEMEQDQQVEETTMVDETVGEVLQEETVENLNPEEPEENNQVLGQGQQDEELVVKTNDV